MTYNGKKKLIMTFLRFDMMSFQTINLKSTIHCKKGSITALYIKFHNLTTRFKVSHKGLSYHHLRSHMIHTFNTNIFSIVSQDTTYSYSYIYQVRDTILPNRDTTYFTLTHITCHSRNTQEQPLSSLSHPINCYIIIIITLIDSYSHVGTIMHQR